MRVTVDEAGRVQLPEEAREKLGLHPGSEVDVLVSNDSVEIMLAESATYLKREGDFLVIAYRDPSAVVTREMTNAIIEELRGVRSAEDDC